LARVADEAGSADTDVETVADFVLVPWVLEPPTVVADVGLEVTWNGAEKI
jgi:hypothetical protein